MKELQRKAIFHIHDGRLKLYNVSYYFEIEKLGGCGKIKKKY